MPGATTTSRPRLRFLFPDGELDTEVSVGQVTDHSVRLWARHPLGPFTAKLRIGRRCVAETLVAPDEKHDHTATAELLPDRPHPGAAFSVEALGLVRSGWFAPGPGHPASFDFAFGSCHQPFHDRGDTELERAPGADIYPRLQAELVRRRARFLLLLGDQIYSDAVSNASVREVLSRDDALTDAELVDTYRHLHRGYFAERGFRALLASIPALMTWDDHDIFDGAGSLLRPTAFDERLRAAGTVAFREYQHLRNGGATVDTPPPLDHHAWYGDTGFFVFDLRGCRDYHAGRIVGETQWRRFDAFLAEAKERAVPTVFVGASVPLVHGSPAIMAALDGLPGSVGKDIRDRWDVPELRHEREALLDRLFAWQAACPRRRAVVLSGDVHVGAAFTVRPRSGAGRIVQWTSSALSTPGGWHHAVANRLVTSLVRVGEPRLRVRRHGLVTGNNAGIVEVRPRSGGGHRLTFRIYAFDARRDVLSEALVHRLP